MVGALLGYNYEKREALAPRVAHTDPVGFGALRGVQKTGVRLAETVFIALKMKFAMTESHFLSYNY